MTIRESFDVRVLRWGSFALAGFVCAVFLGGL
jgi:hypothetical protein